MEEHNIVIGAATYAVSRHFGRQVTKQDLLCDLVLQKLEAGESVDPGAANEV